jgi:hypothetical protein
LSGKKKKKQRKLKTPQHLDASTDEGLGVIHRSSRRKEKSQRRETIDADDTSTASFGLTVWHSWLRQVENLRTTGIRKNDNPVIVFDTSWMPPGSTDTTTGGRDTSVTNRPQQQQQQQRLFTAGRTGHYVHRPATSRGTPDVSSAEYCTSKGISRWLAKNTVGRHHSRSDRL